MSYCIVCLQDLIQYLPNLQTHNLSPVYISLEEVVCFFQLNWERTL